jgi:hypothetical protein
MRMKKIVLLALIALLSVSSCTINDNSEPVATFSQTYSIQKGHWTSAHDDSGDYFYYEFAEPALTRHVYENGIMNAYLQIDKGLNPLPFDDFWIDRFGYKWTDQVTCEFRPGYITFFFKSNDHELEPYYDYTFLVKFMW